MNSILAIALITISLVATNSSCTSYTAATATDHQPGGISVTDDEKHRLYAAALAASESPLDTDIFKDVCKKIGIFDAEGQPNDNYMAFTADHINWGMRSETAQFRQEINSKQKARDYINQHLPH